MSEFRELLLGCGHSRDKRMPSLDGNPHWRDLITLDSNPDCKPDVVCNLDWSPWVCYEHRGIDTESRGEGNHPLIGADQFDEVHAYEVLEHLGYQGIARTFFDTFTEIWRILKPGGHLCATVPSRFSPWLWGDPSHRRAILPETLVFLNQAEYIAQLDGPRTTPMSDFRDLYHADFNLKVSEDNRSVHAFVLEAVKPSRWVPFCGTCLTRHATAECPPK